MRGTTDWVNVLENAFKKIELRDSRDTKSFDLNVSKNVLVYRMGDVLLWNENTLSLFCVNIKAASENPSANAYQELAWNNPPTFEVSKLLLSPNESQLALYGSDGAQILTMPSIKGAHGLFKDGADSVTCSCLSVDEKHFVMAGRKILCCKWHPGFSSPNVLILLTSENSFRIYRADTPQEPFQVIDLNIPLVSSKNVLGESFVSFDFSDEHAVPSASEDENSDRSSLYWTAYLLIGNGQVCSCAMFYDAKSSFKHVLQGPLSVYPPAEDNYGCDACSILYINSNPPTIVIATSEGKLHHCILLSSESSDVSKMNLSSEDILDLKEQSLYVFETVQLELSLKTPQLENSLGCSGEEMDVFSCFVELYKDPIMRQRYHCCHMSGLHSVHISWLFNLEKYFGEENIKLDELDQDEHCIVEHLLCTKPLPLSSVSPIIGFLQIVDVLLGSKIVCLTSDLQISIFPLLQSCKVSKYPLSSEHPTEVKPLHQRGDFSDKIKKILHKKSMNPVIKGSQIISSQDSFKLLCRATQVFREEYIQKYEQVQVELEKNTFRLKTMKTRQEAEVKQLQKDYTDARGNQSTMAGKLEKILCSQEKLSDRLKAIGHKIELSIPMLSESEGRMKKTLKDYQSTIESYEKSINQLSRKCEHYHKEKSKSFLSSKLSSNIITQEKSTSIHTLLKKEGDEICQLQNDLKIIQNILEL